MEEEHHIAVQHDGKKKKRNKINQEIELKILDEMKQTNLEEGEEVGRKKKKKRRRETNIEEEIPENPGIDMKIELIQDRKEKIAPLVGYFPSGFEISKSKEEDDEEEVEIRTFRKKDRPHRLQLVVSPKGKDSTVNFVGASHSGEAAASQICTYGLCLVDKETGSLKIIPIAANKILRLEPVVGGLDLQPKELHGERLTPAEWVQKRRVLTERFGTKKATIKDRKLSNLYRTEDAQTQKVIDGKVDEVELNTEALEPTTGGTSARNIPPHDSTADTPEKAYPLDKIILEGEWNYLPDITKFVGDASLTAETGYPGFVCNRIDKLRQIENEDEKYRLAGIYSYITQLIRFNNQYKEQRVAPYFNQKFSGMFADSGNKYPLGEKRDYLISYVLVLTLIADGYQTDITDIGKDLKLGVSDRRRYYENVGGKLKKNDKNKKFETCVLPVPLKFPQQQKRRRRR